MRRLLFILAFFVVAKVFAGEPTTNDLNEAKSKAKSEHKLILLKFSGSDWCVPCINIQKKVIDTEEFQNFAHQNLVLMNADFPRLKKNKLSEQEQKKNGELADRYDKDGVFPKMVLLDSDGNVLATWNGLKKMDPKFLETEILPYFTKK